MPSAGPLSIYELRRRLNPGFSNYVYFNDTFRTVVLPITAQFGNLQGLKADAYGIIYVTDLSNVFKTTNTTRLAHHSHVPIAAINA